MGFIFYTKGFNAVYGGIHIHPVNIYIEHHHLSHTKYIHKSFELNTYIYVRRVLYIHTTAIATAIYIYI